jgi:hypothetical protein
MTSYCPILKHLRSGRPLEELMQECGLNREELDEVLAELGKPETVAMRDLIGRCDLTESQIGRAFIDLADILERRPR